MATYGRTALIWYQQYARDAGLLNCSYIWA